MKLLCGIIIIRNSDVYKHFVLKKQRQNIFLIFVSILILFSIFPVFAVSQNVANAQSPLACIYNSQNSNGRPVENMTMSLTENPGTQNEKSGVKGHFEILFAEGNEYSLGIDCQNKVAASISITANFLSPNPYTSFSSIETISTSEALPTTGVQITKENEKLKVVGDFVIVSLLPVISTNVSGRGNVQSDILNNYTFDRAYASNVAVILKEDSVSKRFYPTPKTQSDIGLYGCLNKTLICEKHGAGGDPIDPTTTEDLLIKLLDIKIAARTGVTDEASKKFVPTAVRDNNSHNFIRTYIDDAGKIVPFRIQTYAIPTAPVGKSLYMNKDGKTTSVLLEQAYTDGSFRPKPVKSVGFGVYNQKIEFTSSTQYGCIKDSFSTSYAVFNKAIGYSLCNPKYKEKLENVGLKIDGNNGLSASFTIDDIGLRDLNSVQAVKCQDDKTGTGCDETMNIIQMGPFLNLDPDVISDTAWTTVINPWRVATLTYNSYIAYWQGLPLAYKPVDVYIQIFPNKAAWEANIDKPIPSTVPAATDVVSTAQANPESPGQSLYSFIIRVMSAVIIALTSVIYKIFANFIVPVINALLAVKPYEDAFVNIIYPGWLILRNLANIFFIVALLYVGLKILFQQSAAGTAATFIKRLVIFALLVNFSLVIAQGVVGIADTVQSQFLPANTKVIEALGSKLMVEPIVSFRSSVGGGTADNSQLTGDQTISDIAKPIVLLMLAVAAFFSFLAIAAFLAVRLVALMLLYMVSPIAYITAIMDDTKRYSSQWWSEFIKYAFLTPILVFFLNIAALVATAFSASSGNVIKLDDTLAGDLVAGGLTIVSHFIVLLVIFAGMKYALSSGTIGAKTIVDYAQKGFKNTLTKWPGAAKDFIADKAATAADKANRPGLAKAITATAKPWELAKATKKSWIDDGGKERRDRDAKRLAGIPFLTKNEKEIKDPLKKFREKEKEINEDNSGYLADLLSKSASKGDKAATGGAMMRLAKNGDFDDILAGIQNTVGGGVEYSKNAAGLNKATQDLGKKMGFTEGETQALLRNFDTQAGKDKAKRHYSGNVDYKDGKFRVKKLTNDRAGKFEEGDQKEWVKAQAKSRIKMGISDDVNQSGIDSMVQKSADGRTKFSDTQLAVFNGRDLKQLRDKKAGERFRASGNFKQLNEAYQSSGGLDGLKQNMIAFNNRQDAEERLSEDEITEKANAVHRFLFTSRGENNNDEDDTQDQTPRDAPPENTTPPAAPPEDTTPPEAAPQNNRPGFINGRPIIVDGGNRTINPGGNTGQSSQMNAAQSINNTINFSGAAAGNVVGDPVLVSQPPVVQPTVGYAETNVTNDEPKQQRAGFTAPFPKKRQIGFNRTSEKPPKPLSPPAPNSPLPNRLKDPVDNAASIPNSSPEIPKDKETTVDSEQENKNN